MSKSLKYIALSKGSQALADTVARRLSSQARGLGYWAAVDYGDKRAMQRARALEHEVKHAQKGS